MTSSELQRRYLLAMGVTPWVRRGAPPDPESVPERGAIQSMDWKTLGSAVASCTLCELHRARTRTVFGVGDVLADCLVVGEAPGAEEDRRGEPFVGRAGQLLNAMLLAIGLRRDQVYVTNILK